MLTALNDSIMSYCLLSTVLLVNVLILFQGFITYVHSCDRSAFLTFFIQNSHENDPDTRQLKLPLTVWQSLCSYF